MPQWILWHRLKYIYIFHLFFISILTYGNYLYCFTVYSLQYGLQVYKPKQMAYVYILFKAVHNSTNEPWKKN